MTEKAKSDELLTLTADIVSSHVSYNSVQTVDIADLIQSVYKALSSLGTPTLPAAPEKPKGAVSIRASIKHEHLVSMIDGKPYTSLRRHVGKHGYTPDSYREAFELPKDYPMVSASYSEQRRALALKLGLGRKPKAVSEAAPKSRRSKLSITTD